MGVASIIEWALAHLSYWVVFFLMVMENSVVPLPAELIVTPAAYNAANGKMSVVLLIVVSTLGSTVGAIINYYLSLWIGRPAIYKFAGSRWGRLIFLNREKLEKAEELFFSGYTCAQSVVLAFADLTGVDREVLERLSAGLTAKDAEIMESILSQFTLAGGKRTAGK